jgi:ubiquinol-cytochrome c reductase cytochrome b subunit
VLAVVVGLSARHGVTVPQAGIELGAPANPAVDPHTARPEWSFRGLFQLHETLSGWPEMISIFVIPGLTVLLFFAMPFIGRNLVGRALNIAIALLVLGGLGVLTWLSYASDAKNQNYQVAIKEAHRQTRWVKELSESPQKIPVGGALTLLRAALNADAKTQGPRLFNQHCASCHDYSDPAGGINRPEKPKAADLYGFASRGWLTELLTAKGFTSPKFFGNTKFKQKKMYGFIKETFADMEAKEQQQIIQVLANEAGLKSQCDADSCDRENIDAGNTLIRENCTDCHAFHSKSKGTGEKGPDLTGYGSRDWLIGIVSNPAHKQFYGEENDDMPAYAASDAKKRLLSRQELELLADWLRGEWYEPEGK